MPITLNLRHGQENQRDLLDYISKLAENPLACGIVSDRTDYLQYPLWETNSLHIRQSLDEESTGVQLSADSHVFHISKTSYC